MYFSVNLSLNFFVNFSMNFWEREETHGKRVAGGKFLAGYFIWRERDLFLGGKMDRPRLTLHCYLNAM